MPTLEAPTETPIDEPVAQEAIIVAQEEANLAQEHDLLSLFDSVSAVPGEVSSSPVVREEVTAEEPLVPTEVPTEGEKTDEKTEEAKEKDKKEEQEEVKDVSLDITATRPHTAPPAAATSFKSPMEIMSRSRGAISVSGFAVDVTSEGSGFESEGSPGSPGLGVMLKMRSKMKVAKEKSKKHIDIRKAKGKEAEFNVALEKFDHELEVARNRSKIRLQARLEASKTAMAKVRQYEEESANLEADLNTEHTKSQTKLDRKLRDIQQSRNLRIANMEDDDEDFFADFGIDDTEPEKKDHVVHINSSMADLDSAINDLDDDDDDDDDFNPMKDDEKPAKKAHVSLGSSSARTSKSHATYSGRQSKKPAALEIDFLFDSPVPSPVAKEALKGSPVKGSPVPVKGGSSPGFSSPMASTPVAATTTTPPPSDRSGGPIPLGRPTSPTESAFFASPTPTPAPAPTNTSQATLNLVSPQSVSSSVASPGGASVTPDRTKTATPYIEDTHEDLTIASLDRLEVVKRQYQAEKKKVRFHLRLYIKYGESEKIIQMNEQMANLVEREAILNKLLEASREKEGDQGDDMDFDF